MSIEKFGYYAAFISGIAAAGYTVVQVLQVLGVVGKPLDELLIYGFSLCIAPPFLLAIYRYIIAHHRLKRPRCMLLYYFQ